MASKKGRAKAKNPRSEKLTLRLRKSELEQIGTCAERMNESRTNAIMAGIELLEKKQKRER